MISFIIPAKNEEGFIGGCLRSILAQQTGEVFEIVVVDNNSADRTAEEARRVAPEARIFREEKIGTNPARQRGFLESKGEILIFLDADVRLPDIFWLQRTLARFIASEKAVAVSTHYRYYNMPIYQKIWQVFGTFVFIYPWVFLIDKLFRHSAHMVGGMMAIKRQALSLAGGFGKETEFYGDETIISKKLYPLGKIIVSPSLWVWTAGRRYSKYGMPRTVFRYVINYFWVLFTGRPYHNRSLN